MSIQSYKKALKITLGLLFFITGLPNLSAQDYSVDLSKSKLTVLGTSTLHDWEMKAGKFDGEAKFSKANSPELNSLNFSVTIKSLKSGKSGMDKDAYEALKAEEYPKIKYEFEDVLNIEEKAEGYLLEAKGKLSIAGKTRPHTMSVTAREIQEGMRFTGKTSFKMSEFGIEPPSALFGALKAGDQVTVDFDVVYTK